MVIKTSILARGQYPSAKKLAITQIARISKMPNKMSRIIIPPNVDEGWLLPGSSGFTTAAVLLITHTS
jgi:hypothetical protein